jgi:hypothetical protein
MWLCVTRAWDNARVVTTTSSSRSALYCETRSSTRYELMNCLTETLKLSSRQVSMKQLEGARIAVQS